MFSVAMKFDQNLFKDFLFTHDFSYEPGSKLVVLGMAIPPLIGNPYNGYINPYYWVDDHPLLYGNNGSLDPSTYEKRLKYVEIPAAVFLSKVLNILEDVQTQQPRGRTPKA